MIRHALAILCFIVSGFFLYSVSILAFFSIDDDALGKFFIMGLFFIPHVIFHLMGLVLYTHKDWKMPTGITFLIAGLFSVLFVIILFSIKNSPEMTQMMDVEALNTFSDFKSGFTCLTIVLAISIALLWSAFVSNKNAETSPNTP